MSVVKFIDGITGRTVKTQVKNIVTATVTVQSLYHYRLKQGPIVLVTNYNYNNPAGIIHVMTTMESIRKAGLYQ